jgi:hypothetical protein
MIHASRCLVLAVCSWGCAAADPVDPSRLDLSLSDLSGGPGDLATSDMACGIGTPDHCGSCTVSCPGIDDATTARTCSAPTALGTCSLLCKGEHYDVDGDPLNGCELDDPEQASAAAAEIVGLPNTDPSLSTGVCDGANNGCTITHVIGCDLRKHDAAPIDRPDGREDWFKVTASGAGGVNKMKACLSIGNTNWPSDNQYEVCISADGSMSPTTCATAIARMTSMCVQPNGNPDSGTFYVKVRKKQGMPTSLGYALYLEH